MKTSKSQRKRLNVQKGLPMDTTRAKACCGCCCEVCQDRHQAGQHTPECFERFLAHLGDRMAQLENVLLIRKLENQYSEEDQGYPPKKDDDQIN